MLRNFKKPLALSIALIMTSAVYAYAEETPVETVETEAVETVETETDILETAETEAIAETDEVVDNIVSEADNTETADKPATRLDVAEALFALAGETETESAAPFSDTGSPAVAWLYENGIGAGFEDGTFRPNQNIKRDEAMKIINKVLFHTPDKEHFLPDMIKWPDNSNTDAWYYTDVQEATNNHDYERVDKTSPETWTKITQARDWKALEAELAQKYPNR